MTLNSGLDSDSARINLNSMNAPECLNTGIIQPEEKKLIVYRLDEQDKYGGEDQATFFRHLHTILLRLNGDHRFSRSILTSAIFSANNVCANQNRA